MMIMNLHHQDRLIKNHHHHQEEEEVVVWKEVVGWNMEEQLLKEQNELDKNHDYVLNIECLMVELWMDQYMVKDKHV